jgi:hypothetical protein
MRLDPAETAHLFRLARPDLVPAPTPHLKAGVTPSLTALLHGIAPHPAYIVDPCWEVMPATHPLSVSSAALAGTLFIRATFLPGYSSTRLGVSFSSIGMLSRVQLARSSAPSRRANIQTLISRLLAAHWKVKRRFCGDMGRAPRGKFAIVVQDAGSSRSRPPHLPLHQPFPRWG